MDAWLDAHLESGMRKEGSSTGGCFQSLAWLPEEEKFRNKNRIQNSVLVICLIFWAVAISEGDLYLPSNFSPHLSSQLL